MTPIVALCCFDQTSNIVHCFDQPSSIVPHSKDSDSTFQDMGALQLVLVLLFVLQVCHRYATHCA